MNILEEKKVAVIKVNDNLPAFAPETYIINPAFPVYERPYIDYAIDVVLSFGNVEKIYFVCDLMSSGEYISKIKLADTEICPIVYDYHPFETIYIENDFPRDASVIFFKSESLLFGDLKALTKDIPENCLNDGVSFFWGESPLGLYYRSNKSVKSFFDCIDKGIYTPDVLEEILQGKTKDIYDEIKFFKKNIISKVFRYDIKTIKDIVEATKIISIYSKPGRDVANIKKEFIPTPKNKYTCSSYFFGLV